MTTQNAMNISLMELKSMDSLIKKRYELSKHINAVGLADSMVYTYVKDASFFGKRQQRSVFTFFEGLNTNPQNLSVFLRNEAMRINKQSKQKLAKGQFIIYDMFNKNDCVIEINIPGNFQIYKLRNQRKQVISSEQIDAMYISSILRSMYCKNIVWGRCYPLFGTKNMLEQYKSFLFIFFKIIQKHDIFINDDFQHSSNIKGSHACQILFNFIQQKLIGGHSIIFIESYMSQKGGCQNIPTKLLILLTQLYSHQSKYSKSLQLIVSVLDKYNRDPYLLYYYGKYLFKLMTVHQALFICNSIVHYDQFEVWALLAQIHIELKNYGEALVCLNHASRIVNTKVSMAKTVQSVYLGFDGLGKKNLLNRNDQITLRPRLMYPSETPPLFAGLVEDGKYKALVESEYHRLSSGQKIVYNILRSLKYRLDNKKFQQLFDHTFQLSKKEFVAVSFKTGMTQSMFVQEKKNDLGIIPQKNQIIQTQDLPNFLQDEQFDVQNDETIKGNRNLSIIPELQSIVENSQFEQREKQMHKLRPVKTRKQLNESFQKLLYVLSQEHELQKAQFEQNWAKVCIAYNKLRSASKSNTFYTKKMFEIMIKVENYHSILVLIADSLDTFEQMGVKSIQVLPFWMQKYIFEIIQSKGLKFLNNHLESMKFLDEAIIDTISLAKNWKIKGCTF